MSHTAFVLESPSRIVDLLDREFAPSRLRELAGGIARPIPWRLWSKALYAPLHEFLGRPGKEFRAELLLSCWRLGGRTDDPPTSLAFAVEALHAGSLIVDDIEDDSDERRGGPALHRAVGVPTALNAGNWLYFWPLCLLDEIDCDAHARGRAQSLAGRLLLECHYGQALDLATGLADLAQPEVAAVVRAITALKTGSLTALAAGLGAVVSGASDELVSASIRFGRDIGIGLQMADDLSGLVNPHRRHKGAEDLALGRPTWIWAWTATMVDPHEFERLRSLQLAVSAGQSSAELAKWLCGHVAEEGRLRVRSWLRRALERLARTTSNTSALHTLRHQIQRLEQSYV